jgi:hypothetical protein
VQYRRACLPSTIRVLLTPQHEHTTEVTTLLRSDHLLNALAQLPEPNSRPCVSVWFVVGWLSSQCVPGWGVGWRLQLR